MYGSKTKHLLALLVTSAQLSFGENKSIGELSLEELANVPLVQSKKQSSRLFDAPVNSYVFDEEALNYLPVDSLPELLRYAPGVHVVRPTSGNWGIGIHGMNSKWFSKTPFTVDDQNVDASIFSGLLGSQHDLLLQDIAAVEVVYGPGSVLWPNSGGNGTINIVMKTAFETLGNYTQLRVGSKNRSAEARSGWTLDNQSAIRVYGKYSNRAESDSGSDFDDSWETARIGTRYDLRWTSEDLLSLTADIHGSVLGYEGREPTSQEALNNGLTPTFSEDEEFAAINIQAKWLRQITEDEGFSFRSWGSFSSLDAAYGNSELYVFGLEARDRRQLQDGSQILLTGGAITNVLRMMDNFTTTFTDEDVIDTTAHIGAQWTKPIADDTLNLSLGISARYESLGQTIELSPTASLLYKPTASDRIWISYHRSASTINSLGAYGDSIRGRSNELEPNPIFAPIEYFHYIGVNNEDLKNEEIQNFELGYRRQLSSKTEFGTTVFYNIYKNLTGYAYEGFAIRNTPTLFDPFARPYLEIKASRSNIADAEAFGVDAYLTWNISENWQATATYAYLEECFTNDIHSNPTDPLASSTNRFYYEILSENSPRHIASLWIVGDLTDTLRTDIGFRHTSSYEAGRENQQDSITQMDGGLTWAPNDQLEVSLIGRNLLKSLTEDDTLKDSLGNTTQLEREWYIELTYLF